MDCGVWLDVTKGYKRLHKLGFNCVEFGAAFFKLAGRYYKKMPRIERKWGML